jgi:hypothetical protein
VDGVAGLETHHLRPVLLGQQLPELVRLVVVAGEGPGLRLLHEQGNLAAQERIALAMQSSDAGVLAVGGAVDLEGLTLLVVGVAVLDDHGGDDLPAAGREGNLLAVTYLFRLVLRDGERDRHAPHQAVCEAHALDD